MEKGALINNESIVRAHVKNTKEYKIYEEKYSVSDFEQIDIDEMMRINGQPGHWFGIKYPPIDGAFLVFREMLPVFDPVFEAVKINFPGAISELASKLPPYKLMIKDLPEGTEPPTEEEIKEELSNFLNIWISINTLDELVLKEQLEGATDGEFSEENIREESENTEES